MVITGFTADFIVDREYTIARRCKPDLAVFVILNRSRPKAWATVWAAVCQAHKRRSIVVVVWLNGIDNVVWRGHDAAIAGAAVTLRQDHQDNPGAFYPGADGPRGQQALPGFFALEDVELSAKLFKDRPTAGAAVRRLPVPGVGYRAQSKRIGDGQNSAGLFQHYTISL